MGVERPIALSAGPHAKTFLMSTQTQWQCIDFDCSIVDASEQDMHETPSLRSGMLLPMLTNSVVNVLPATLELVRHSDHSAMDVQYTTAGMPRERSPMVSKVMVGGPLVSLLASSSASSINQAI